MVQVRLQFISIKVVSGKIGKETRTMTFRFAKENFTFYQGNLTKIFTKRFFLRFDPHATQFITFNQMSDFIGSLDPPLGIPKPNSLAIVSFDLPIAKGDKIHCLDVLHSLTKYTLGFVEDDSEDLCKLTEQMDEKFKKQFPTRKELEIVSSTREWKRLDTAARCIQKFYRFSIRERNGNFDTFESRVDTETQTRALAARQGSSAASRQQEQPVTQQPALQFQTEEEFQTEDNPVQEYQAEEYPDEDYQTEEYQTEDYPSQEYQADREYPAGEVDYTQECPARYYEEQEVAGETGPGAGVAEQCRRQEVARAQLAQYTRPAPPRSSAWPGEPGPGRLHRPELSPGRPGRRGLIYSGDYGEEAVAGSLDHPHSHQFEDEVCLRCDTAGLPRPGPPGCDPYTDCHVYPTVSVSAAPRRALPAARPPGRQLPASPRDRRRPVSYVPPRSDQGSLPRRRLPETPQPRHADTLPRAAPRQAGHRRPHPAGPPAWCAQAGPDTAAQHCVPAECQRTTRRSPGKSSRPPGRGPGRPTPPHQPAGPRPTLPAAPPHPAHRPGHTRSRSEAGQDGAGRRPHAGKSGRSGKHRVRRQSPVEERLSVHESDSMSDAFDDDGLFQIDENFAKFLDDKTSCQK